MRKPRDYDAELKALDDKVRRLKQRRLHQLGELVIACGADALAPEQLAGALLAIRNSDAQTKEGWRRQGAAFFQRRPPASARTPDEDPDGTLPFDSGKASA
jgi:ubiquitin